MLNNFLKHSGLTFEEYKEWFSSLEKGSEILRFRYKEPFLVNKSSNLEIEIVNISGSYSIIDDYVIYKPMGGPSYPAESFPTPFPKEINIIKEKRSKNFCLQVGEVYEDSEGIEWTVNDTAVPFSIAGSFHCECSNPGKGIRYYTSRGKFAETSHRFDLVKKKEKQMTIKDFSENLEQSRPFALGQVWEDGSGKEYTIISWDEGLGKFLLFAEDNSGVWILPSGYESWSNKKYAVKYLGETKKPRLEVGKSYYKNNGELIVIIKRDDSDDTYQGNDDLWYYQFGFPYDSGDSSIIRAAENEAETKSLAVGDMYQTKGGEIFEVKSKEPCGRFKCLSPLGEVWFYSKEGKLTPDYYDSEMDFVCQFMPEFTNSNKKNIEYFASEIEKNLKDLLTELKTKKARVELSEENLKLSDQIRTLTEENLNLKQKLASFKAFLEPDHK